MLLNFLATNLVDDWFESLDKIPSTAADLRYYYYYYYQLIERRFMLSPALIANVIHSYNQSTLPV